MEEKQSETKERRWPPFKGTGMVMGMSVIGMIVGMFIPVIGFGMTFGASVMLISAYTSYLVKMYDQ